jgi:ATP-dependent Clp protease ATP-binding subunit ClpA
MMTRLLFILIFTSSGLTSQVASAGLGSWLNDVREAVQRGLRRGEDPNAPRGSRPPGANAGRFHPVTREFETFLARSGVTDLTDKAIGGAYAHLAVREADALQAVRFLSGEGAKAFLTTGKKGLDFDNIPKAAAHYLAHNSDTLPETLQNSRIFELNIISLMDGTKNVGEINERLGALIGHMEDNASHLYFIKGLEDLPPRSDNNPITSLDQLRVYLESNDRSAKIWTRLDEDSVRHIEGQHADNLKAFGRQTLEELNEEQTIRTLIPWLKGMGREHQTNVKLETLYRTLKAFKQFAPNEPFPEAPRRFFDDLLGELETSGNFAPDKLTQLRNEVADTTTLLEVRRAQRGPHFRAKVAELEEKLRDQTKRLQEAETQLAETTTFRSELDQFNENFRGAANSIDELLERFQTSAPPNRAEIQRALRSVQQELGAQREMVRNDWPEVSRLLEEASSSNQTVQPHEAVTLRNLSDRLRSATSSEANRFSEGYEGSLYNELTDEEIIPHLARRLGIDESILEAQTNPGEFLRKLREEAESKIVGAERALNSWFRVLATHFGGARDNSGAAALIVQVGEPGGGKSFTPEQLAEMMNAKHLAYNGTEFKDPTSIKRITGADPNYVGYGEVDDYLDQIQRNNNDGKPTFLVLDDLHEADPAFTQLAFTVRNQPFKTNSKGERVYFNNVFVIMNSNHLMGGRADQLLQQTEGMDRLQQLRVYKEALLEEDSVRWSRPLLDGVTDIILYGKLPSEANTEFVKAAWGRWSRSIDTRNRTIELDESAINFIARYDFESNRELRDFISSTVADRLNRHFNDGTIPEGSIGRVHIETRYNDDGIEIEPRITIRFVKEDDGPEEILEDFIEQAARRAEFELVESEVSQALDQRGALFRPFGRQVYELFSDNFDIDKAILDEKFREYYYDLLTQAIMRNLDDGAERTRDNLLQYTEEYLAQLDGNTEVQQQMWEQVQDDVLAILDQIENGGSL